MRKFSRVILISTIISSMVVVSVYAEPSSDALKNEKNETVAEANALKSDLQDALDSIEQLKKDIKDKNEQLDKTGKEMELAEQSEYEQYEAMKRRIQYIYEEGTSTKQVENIFEAKSIADMLNQVLYVNEVYAYDRVKLDEYIKIKEEVQEKHEQYEKDLADYEDAQELMVEKQQGLTAMIADKQDEIALLDDQIRVAIEREAEEARRAEEARLEAERLEKERLEQERLEQERLEQERLEQEQLEQEQAENNNSNGSSNENNNSNGSSNENNNSNSGSNGNSNNGGNTTEPEKEEPQKEEPEKEEPAAPSGSASGQKVVNYAMQFIGNKYVYGGNSLTNGIDCSGFTQQVYKKFGYSIPRTSYAQRSAGKGVSYSEAQPGDLICYSGHVALYIGNGQIVHASNSAPYPQGGIKTGSATYRSILAVRRIIY